MPTPVYGIFEGGGAKGLGHIAALKAVEKNDMVFVGVAGASAGALIAALVAVGYKADDLFDPDNPNSNLLTRNNVTPLSLIGIREWEIFSRAKQQAVGAARAGFFGGGAVAWLFGRQTVRVAREVQSTGGYFTTELMRRTLNDFLHMKMRRNHADAGRKVSLPERIRFRDIDPASFQECCSLKVIVTNVTNGRMVVFDGSNEFADVEVAEAVAASIAIPVVFKPARIPSYQAGGGALYADGGLVSNLPIWVFTEEKLNFERAVLPNGRVPILGFTLADEPSDPGVAVTAGSLSYWVAVGRSAVFGGQSAVRPFVSDLHPIEMPIRLGVTEFDFIMKRGLDAYADAYAAAMLYISRNMRIFPTEFTHALQKYHTAAMNVIQAHHSGNQVRMIRVCIILPEGRASFKVTHSYNMDTDADDRFVFSRYVDGGAPVAFKTNLPSFVDFTGLTDPPLQMTKYEAVLRRRDLHSAICIPLFRGPKDWDKRASARDTFGVLSVDSSDSLTHIFEDDAAMKALAAASVAVSAGLLEIIDVGFTSIEGGGSAEAIQRAP
jgi:NTE family protein